MFFNRSVQKVGQKGWGTDFWGGALAQGPTKGNPYCGPERKGGAFALIIIVFERSRCICAYYSSV